MNQFPEIIQKALRTQGIELSKAIRYYSHPEHYDSIAVSQLVKMQNGIVTALESGQHNSHSRKALQLRIDHLAQQSTAIQKQAGFNHLQQVIAGMRNYSTRRPGNGRLSQRKIRHP